LRSPPIPLICLCIAIVLHRLWQWRERAPEYRPIVYLTVFGYLTVALLGFWYFFPELAGIAIPYSDWHDHLWLQSWILRREMTKPVVVRLRALFVSPNEGSNEVRFRSSVNGSRSVRLYTRSVHDRRRQHVRSRLITYRSSSLLEVLAW